ncbi:MAG: gamma-glutamylcyclotransferase [Pseudomonadales bacterium]
MSQWLFGYGSLIWRPDFEFLDAARATLPNYARKFWQGSHDHRGVPEAPGRVVTLIDAPGSDCGGMAYQISEATSAAILSALDHREKNGYERRTVTLTLPDREHTRISALVYLGAPGNFAWFGDAPDAEIAHQISRASGPSGSNVDYLFKLADALRKLEYQDDHVFTLERAVRALQSNRSTGD